MKPDEMRIALAQHEGWTDIQEYGCFIKGIEPGTGFDEPIPEYLNDLNAVHRIEATLNTVTLRHFYYFHLATQAETARDGSHKFGVNLCWATTHADAAQRAEALLRTFNKWKP